MLTPSEQQVRAVHLVDGDEDYRNGTSRMLESAGYHTRAYSSAAAFLESYDSAMRGCIVLEMKMPEGIDGPGLQKEMQLRNGSLPIIFLTATGDIPSSVRAIKDGAFDFLTKAVSGEILIKVVKEAMAAESQIWNSKNTCKERLGRLKSLTKCERNVFLRMIVGLSTRRICDEIGSATRTVNTHRANVMRKMEVATVPQLIREMHRLRLSMGELSYPTVESLFDA